MLSVTITFSAPTRLYFEEQNKSVFRFLRQLTKWQGCRGDGISIPIPTRYP